MDDNAVLHHINDLVEEEHRLHESNRDGQRLDEGAQKRLQAVEVALDQCWDLLRQRRANRHAGRDADQAHERDAATVENYRQ
jgi:hypothetical protein